MINNHAFIINDFAQQINDGLDRYINVHNFIIRESSTFKSLLKNIFGKGVSNKLFLEKARSLESHWEILITTMEFYFDYNESEFTPQELGFSKSLLTYSYLLRDTVSKLIERQEFLYFKSESKGGSLKSYDRLEDEYQTAILEYMNQGLVVDQMYYRFKQSK